MPLVFAATPIGDPEDASPRLRHALATADVIAAEDTRRLRRLAAALDVTITGRVIASYDAVERQRSQSLLDRVAAGQTVLVVTDAGMPLVSDPGHVLATGAIAADLPLTVLPGPSAVTTAIALSGLPVDRFCFEGFLPRKAGERRRRLAELAHDQRAHVLFEAPHRLGAALADMVTAFGSDRPAAICRELTKTYEEVLRGTLGQLAGRAATEPLRGEITVVVAGAIPAAVDLTSEQLAKAVAELVSAGTSRRDAISQVAATSGVPRRAVYSAAVGSVRPEA